MDIVQIRREFHRHPELGYEETWTSARIAQILGALGIGVTCGVAGTGVVGVLRGRDSSLGALGYRADMDALPVTERTGLEFAATNGCMHACGHDAHIAVALGVAERMARASAGSPCLAHDLVFVFQPNAEGAPGEKPSGAEWMCREGVLERFGIRRMLAIHCDPDLEAGKLGLCQGAVWAASARFVISVTGEAAHAAYPERGRDALWAASQIVSSVYAAMARRRAKKNEVVSICRLQAGCAFNVIAGSASMEGILRASSHEEIRQIFGVLKETAQGVADACRVGVETVLYLGAEAVINDAAMVACASHVWQAMNVAAAVDMKMASEDFSSFSARIPCLYAMMGVKKANGCAPLHADTFDIDEKVLEPTVGAMCALCHALDEARKP